jgi:hypothetical protein
MANVNRKCHDERMVMLNELERMGKEQAKQQDKEASIHLLGFRLWSSGFCVVLQVDIQARVSIFFIKIM